MDKRCVLNWLTEVYVTPSRAFDEYTEYELKMFAHDAIVLLKEQEPVEPKTGKWITRLRHEHYPSGKPYEEDFCSECGKRGSLEYPFCPWCGIKMESGERND